jgi:hypothetical protein
MEDPRKLRALAGWYREIAERAGNPAIWELRLRTAKDLEREADRLEKMAARRHQIAQGVVEQDSGSMRNGRFDHGSETKGVHPEV